MNEFADIQEMLMKYMVERSSIYNGKIDIVLLENDSDLVSKKSKIKEIIDLFINTEYLEFKNMSFAVKGNVEFDIDEFNELIDTVFFNELKKMLIKAIDLDV